GLVVVVPRFCPPARAGMRIEGPVRQVDAAQRVGEGSGLQPIGREPSGAVPLADPVTYLPVAQLEGQDALRRDGVTKRLLLDDGGRAAEVAALRHMAIDEDGDGMAMLALDLLALLAPA